MPTRTGQVGTNGLDIVLSTAQSLNLTMDSSEYPNGTFTFNFTAVSPSGGWMCDNSPKSIVVYLCDSSGNNKITLFTVNFNNTQQTLIQTPNSVSVSNSSKKLKGKDLYIIATGDTTYLRLYSNPTVTVTTAIEPTAVVQYNKIYATDRSQIGTSTTRYAIMSDSHFSTGTKANASTFNSQVLGM